MPSVNYVEVIGHLGKDPEVRFTGGRTAVCNFTVATSEKWKDKSSGEAKEKTEWHRIVAWGKTAELCGQHLHKGALARITGKLETREWTDKEGHKNYTTEIVADNVLFMDRKGEGKKPEKSESQNKPADPDIPF